jgi:hypothetical protein
MLAQDQKSMSHEVHEKKATGGICFHQKGNGSHTTNGFSIWHFHTTAQK